MKYVCEHGEYARQCETCNDKARIKELEEWIAVAGENYNECTYHILHKRCETCNCGRKL